MKVNDFCLISFKSDRFTLPLHAASDADPGHKATIIIGANGSGKSTALAAVIDELAALRTIIQPTTSSVRIYRDVRVGRSEINYRLNGKVYRILREGTAIEVFEDGEKYRGSLVKLPFPSRAIAVAHLPADRFRFSRNRENDFYCYHGLRQATNLTTTGALEAKVIESLLNNLGRDGYRRALNEWSRVLELDGHLWLEFRHLQVKALHIRSIDDLSKISNRARNGRIEEYLNDEENATARQARGQALGNFFFNLEKFARQRFDPGEPPKYNRVSIEIPFEATGAFNAPDTMSLVGGIELVRRFRLAEEVRLIISKKGVPTPFSELSSGERQILGTVTRLLESAQDGSVIAIDEPEVSLHPAWQLQYMPTLFRALGHLKATHVLIATHSHFMVSSYADGVNTALVVAGPGHGANSASAGDVTESNESSETIQLNSVESPQDSPWAFEVFDGPVEGRTPENILYRVFGVGTAASFYVEQDLARALEMISNVAPMNLGELRAIRHRLRRIEAPDNPAFAEILKTIDEQLEIGLNA